MNARTRLPTGDGRPAQSSCSTQRCLLLELEVVPITGEARPEGLPGQVKPKFMDPSELLPEDKEKPAEGKKGEKQNKAKKAATTSSDSDTSSSSNSGLKLFLRH